MRLSDSVRELPSEFERDTPPPFIVVRRDPIGMSIFWASITAALILVGSWQLAATRSLWDQLDLRVFRLLNGSLNFGGPWQILCGFANWRVADAVPGLLLFVLFWNWYVRVKPERRARRLAIIMVFCAVLSGAKIVSSFVVHELLDYHRLSPTLVYEDAHRLSETFTLVKPKDQSPHSFPGDHGLVLLMSVAFFLYWGTTRDTMISSGIGAVFLMPRLISGAHWLTDICVGSLTTALIAAAVAFASPLSELAIRECTVVARQVERVLDRLLELSLGRKPKTTDDPVVHDFPDQSSRRRAA